MARSAPLGAEWLSPGDAMARITRGLAPLPAEEVPLAQALGRALAEDVRSPITIPPWDNSAVDGFAVRAQDIRGASADRPIRLHLVGEVPAGRLPDRTVGPGEAVKVMTGAPIPEGADSVVRVEDTDGGNGRGGHVTVRSDRDAARNVRPRGEDVRQGHVVLAARTTLSPAGIGLLAAVGRAAVRVHRRPRVALLSNGDELVDLDAFAEVMAGRRIVNSNGYALAAAIEAAGAEVVNLGIARDDAGEIRRRLELARESDADVLVTSAGASVGERDLLKAVLGELGFHLDFWRVRIRPGSPFTYGSLPRPAGPPLPVFGLPGNPVSALVTFELFVRPALRMLAGHRRPFRPIIATVAAEPLPGAKGLTHFPRVRLARQGAAWTARLTGPQGSSLLTSIAEADGLAIVPHDRANIAPGEPVTVILLDNGAAAADAPLPPDAP